MDTNDLPLDVESDAVAKAIIRDWLNRRLQHYAGGLGAVIIAALLDDLMLSESVDE